MNLARRKGLPTSTRQAITISKLGHTRRVRKSCLSEGDFIEIAVLTTPPPHQETARELAEAILRQVQPLQEEEDLGAKIDRFLEKTKAPRVDSKIQEEDRPFHEKPMDAEHISREEFERLVTKRLDAEGFHETFSFISNMDKGSETDFVSEFLDLADEELKNTDLDELLGNVQNNEAWVDAVTEKLESHNERQKDQDTLQRLLQATEQLSDPELREDMADGPLSQMIESLLDQSETFEEFMELKRIAEETGARFPVDLARKRGEALGFSDRQLAELEASPENFLKAMIENGSTDYNSASRALSTGKLPNHTAGQLLDIAIENEDAEAVAAFLTHRFAETLKKLAEKKAEEELLRQALGTADGENLLERWFAERTGIPETFREILRDYARSVLIELGRYWKSSFGNGMEQGIFAGGTLRPWREGDEFDQIDIEESLENILQSGKSLDDISPTDILVRDYDHGKRAVLMLIDSSGSMAGLPLKTAIATAVMLAYAMRNEDLGIGVFQSNTSVYCSVGDRRRHLEEIVDGLLSMEAKGGTVVGAGIEWVQKELTLTRAIERIIFVITDSLIFDLRENLAKIEGICNETTKMIFVVPDFTDDFRNHQWLIEKAGALFLPLTHWKEFPAKIRDILARG